MKTVYCYYHNYDLDGVTSASVVKKKYPKAEFFGWNYGENINIVLGYDIVFIVDLTLPENVMKDLIKNNKKVIWIDHHGRKIQDMEKRIGNKVDGLRDTKNYHSACVLTWNYLYPNQSIPTMLKHIEDIDLWKFNLPETDKVCSALWIKYGENVTAYVDFLDKKRWSMVKFELYKMGEAHVNQREALVDKMMPRVNIKKWKGYKTAIINSSVMQSFVGNKALDKYDVEVALVWNVVEKGMVRCSLRSKNVDVSKIAKQLDGGGHPQASGFQTNLKEFIEMTSS